ncbi:BN3D2 methyltransferase, partial [Amia calva]|nr:BN3D2 methyltransferase [Amia calva]
MAASIGEGAADDPGAAPYGNFINYYDFNPPENRLSLIPATLLQDLGYSAAASGPILTLDVGCNSGDLSVALYRHLVGHMEGAGDPQLYMLGCDLDEVLIQRAQQANPFPQTVNFISLDITQEQACRAQLGGYLSRFGRCSFDLGSCLAVTMWVHLNHGDQALLDLLSRLATLCRHLLLEAQPWKCYRSAARRFRKLGRRDFEHFKDLGIRGDMAVQATKHLEQSCGMELVRSLGSTAWDRRLLLFRRRPAGGEDGISSTEGGGSS